MNDMGQGIGKYSLQCSFIFPKSVTFYTKTSREAVTQGPVVEYHTIKEFQDITPSLVIRVRTIEELGIKANMKLYKHHPVPFNYLLISAKLNHHNLHGGPMRR